MSQTFGLSVLLKNQNAEDRADTLRVWRIALIVTFAIGLAKHVPMAIGLAGLAAAAAQLIIPLRYALTSKEGDDGIGYSFSGLGRDIPILLAIIVITFIPFWYLHDWWWSLLGVADGTGSQLGIPNGDAAVWISTQIQADPVFLSIVSLAELVAIHLLGVALPEELFYRGFLQPKLCRSFDDKPIAFGLVWNHGIALAAVLFALAHFLGEYNPARLGPFFPALILGMLRRRSGSIASAVVLHAAFNIYGALLFAGLAIQ